MLYTLHGYILRELGKVFAIAAGSLTVILSLGGLLQPLRHQGVSAMQLFQLILYFFPVMLTFSLPVASLLAATLVYGRLSADNELIACRASGIGMLSLVLPALGLGVVVMGSNLLLSNWFIPGCAKRAAEVVKEDIQQIAVNKLKNDKELAYEKYVITAERVESRPPHVVLIAPSVTELRQGVPQQIIMCKTATLEFDPANSLVTVFPEAAIQMNRSSLDEPARVLSLPMRWRIPPIVRDDVSFKSYDELRQLLRDPEPFIKVKRELDRCRRMTEQRLIYDDIWQTLKGDTGPPRQREYVMKYEDIGRNPPVLNDATITARDLERTKDGLMLGRAEDPEPRVRIALYGPSDSSGRRGPLVTVYTAWQAELRATDRDDAIGPMADVDFPGRFERQNMPVQGPPAVKAKGKMVERLLPQSNIVEQVARMPRDRLMATDSMKKQVDRQIDKLRRNIIAELHSRGAFSIAGLVLVLLGAALGVVFRSGHVLVAFGVAAVPAMFAITMVIMGNKVTTNSSSSLGQWGVLLTWSGNAAILGLDAWVFSRLLRH